MTTQEFIGLIDKQLEAIEDNKFLLPIIGDIHAMQVKRVFDSGINGNGAKIGSYNSVDPIYIHPDKSPRQFPKKGKTGETTFKNGKSHKTGYFDSYKAFRSAISIESGFVNLTLTRDLRFDFTNSLTIFPTFIGSGVKRKENADKVNGHVAKYGIETYFLTETERQLFLTRSKKRLIDTLNNNPS